MLRYCRMKLRKRGNHSTKKGMPKDKNGDTRFVEYLRNFSKFLNSLEHTRGNNSACLAKIHNKINPASHAHSISNISAMLNKKLVPAPCPLNDDADNILL